MHTITIENLESIDKSAAEFINLIGNNTVFAFEGAMGAGKTTFIKAICENLGVDDVINSPTFSIINEYRNNRSGKIIYHFDFYRVNSIKEAQEIGTEDYFYSGELCFIEWAEKIKELLPNETIIIHMKEQPDHSRIVTFHK